MCTVVLMLTGQRNSPTFNEPQKGPACMVIKAAVQDERRDGADPGAGRFPRPGKMMANLNGASPLPADAQPSLQLPARTSRRFLMPEATAATIMSIYRASYAEMVDRRAAGCSAAHFEPSGEGQHYRLQPPASAPKAKPHTRSPGRKNLGCPGPELCFPLLWSMIACGYLMRGGEVRPRIIPAMPPF